MPPLGMTTRTLRKWFDSWGGVCKHIAVLDLFVGVNPVEPGSNQASGRSSLTLERSSRATPSAPADPTIHHSPSLPGVPSRVQRFERNEGGVSPRPEAL
jgi:hypothetical protein